MTAEDPGRDKNLAALRVLRARLWAAALKLLPHEDVAAALTAEPPAGELAPAVALAAAGGGGTGGGPGAELHALLAAWGYDPEPGCPCRARMAQMDRWGSKGCRRNYWTIVGWLKDAAAEDAGWLAVAADKLGLVPGVVDKAIRNAEAKGF